MSNFITNKVEGDTLEALEWNQLAELNNLITSSGQSLDANVLEQVAKAIANYTNSGNFYTENGVANAYTLVASGSFKAPTSYTAGMVVRFITTNANTTTTPTINLAGLGSKNIKKADGTPVIAGDINGYVELRYNGTDFLIHKEKIYFKNSITIANSLLSPNDTIDFGAGTYITLSGNQIYLPAITKKIQSSGSWTAGTGANGLDTGARAINTFYRTNIIQNNSTQAYDILFSASGSPPTIPSGYTNLGLLDYALIRVNGSNNIAGSQWDAYNKQLVLGPSEIIQVFSSLAGSGSAQVLITTEPLEMQIRISLTTTVAGGSDISVWGSEHNGNDGFDTVQATTNNGFSTSVGFSPIYTSNGTIYWRNFSTAGGISNQTCKLKSIKFRG